MGAMQKRLWREKALAEQDGRCFYCKCTLTPATATLEHLHPLAKGGTDEPKNRAVACRDCNQLKGSLFPSQFVRILKGREPTRNLLRRMQGREEQLAYARFRRKLFVATDNACQRIRRSVTPSRHTVTPVVTPEQ